MCASLDDDLQTFAAHHELRVAWSLNSCTLWAIAFEDAGKRGDFSGGHENAIIERAFGIRWSCTAQKPPQPLQGEHRVLPRSVQLAGACS